MLVVVVVVVLVVVVGLVVLVLVLLLVLVLVAEGQGAHACLSLHARERPMGGCGGGTVTPLLSTFRNFATASAAWALALRWRGHLAILMILCGSMSSLIPHRRKGPLGNVSTQ